MKESLSSDIFGTVSHLFPADTVRSEASLSSLSSVEQKKKTRANENECLIRIVYVNSRPIRTANLNELALGRQIYR